MRSQSSDLPLHSNNGKRIGSGVGDFSTVIEDGGILFFSSVALAWL